MEIIAQQHKLACRIGECRLVLFALPVLASVSTAVAASRWLSLKAFIAGWLRSHDTRVGVIESDSFSRRYPGCYPSLHEVLGFFRHHKIELGVDIQRHARASVHL